MNEVREAKQLLMRVDSLLGKVYVSGDSVISLAEARMLLKAAYEELPEEGGEKRRENKQSGESQKK